MTKTKKKVSKSKTDNVNEHSVKDWKENLADGIIEFKDKILSNIER